MKLTAHRFNFKKFFIGLLVLKFLMHKRIEHVNYFDRLRRREQRAMNNKEVNEFYGKKVQFCMFLLKKIITGEKGSETTSFEYLQFTETSQQEETYTIFWYDPRQDNYINLNKFLDNKKMSQARIKTYLVVDKQEVAEKSSEIFEQLKKKSQILLKRDLSD